MALISTVTTLLLSSLGLNEVIFPEQASLKNNTFFDYIIIGAGTAGCVVARRLAEDKKFTVLLLEAGGDPPESAFLPGQFSMLPETFVDYNYTSIRDDYAAGSQGNYTKLTAGKMFGGSSAINHLMHTRGIKLDYDRWAKIVSDNSWNYDSVLPYFKKSEKVSDKDVIDDYPDYHGTDGPMILSRQTDDSLSEYFDAVKELNIPVVSDLNANVAVGSAEPLLMIGNGLRQFPGFSYMKAVKNNPNLSISKNTRVTKIIIEDHTAVGVEAVYNDETYTFRANKEVILSAGVFNSPQILMLSGIGPQDHLESLGINVIADLPVGDNLADQVSVTLVYKTKSYSCPPNPAELESIPTKLPFPVFVGAVPLNKSETVPNYQTFNMLLKHDSPLLQSACSDTFGYRPETCQRWEDQLSSRDTLYTVLADLQPKSRGTVRLTSTDPFADPSITTGYFTNKEDLTNMVNYVKDMNKILDTEFFKKIDADIAGLDLPECAGEERGTDEFWECYILNSAISPYHYTSTCPMGSVVDAELKLKGFDKLRVIDASVLPGPIHGAPNAAIIMLAERASDIIKGTV